MRAWVGSLASLDRPRDLGGFHPWRGWEPCQHSGSTPKYPEELRERAVKMELEVQAVEGRGRSEVAR